MGSEAVYNKFAELCHHVGTAHANQIIDEDPFAGCVFSPGEYFEGVFTQDEIDGFNNPCQGCEWDVDCSKCEYSIIRRG